jgi:acetyl-CoA carboxylase carboxyl transferase subunit alpha
MKITAPDLLELGVVDRIVEEPPGGAHQDPLAAAKLVDAAMSDALAELLQMTPDELVEQRYARFRKMGAFVA